MTDSSLSWWAPQADPEYKMILDEAVAAAHKDRPDVYLSAAELPPAFGRVMQLCVERLFNLQADAIKDAAADVDFVIANARFIDIETAEGTSTVPDLQDSSASRSAARRAGLISDVIRVRERVASRSAVHAATVESVLAYGVDVMAELDRLIRTNHRFSFGFSYQVPTTIPISLSVYEIGLGRVNAAVPGLNADGPSTESEAAA